MVNVFLMMKIHECFQTTTDAKTALTVWNWTVIWKFILNTFELSVIGAYWIEILYNSSTYLLKLKDAKTITLRKLFIEVFPHGFNIADVYYSSCDFLSDRIHDPTQYHSVAPRLGFVGWWIIWRCGIEPSINPSLFLAIRAIKIDRLQVL